MGYRKRIYYTDADKELMWDRWQAGESLHSIARLFDRHHPSIQGVLAHLVDNVWTVAAQIFVMDATAQHTADFFRGPSRSHVCLANPEHYLVNKQESVVQHQSLNFRIVTSTPIVAREKCPPDLNLPSDGIKSVIAA